MEKKRMIFLLPSLLGTFFFFLLPFGIMIVLAVKGRSFGATCSNTAFQKGCANTAIFMIAAIAISVGLGLLTAIQSEALLRRPVVQAILVSPLLVSASAAALIWQAFFQHDGIVNEMIHLLGNTTVDFWKTSWGMPVLILLFIWKTVGFYALLFAATLAKIPRELSQTAQMDGAAGWHRFLAVEFPYLVTTILFAAMTAVVQAFRMFREIYTLTGDYPFDGLYFVQHYLLHTFHKLDYGSASAAAILLTVVLFVLVRIGFSVADQGGGDVWA
jgi:multiple sugar transport system permease protein